MTAEIAILNKSAVALAADSAVTISAGTTQEKIYDTADKLFELSSVDPIGIMINSDMNFMGTPLPVLIKEYRSRCPAFRKVEDAAADFLKYLHEYGVEAGDEMKQERLRISSIPLVKTIMDRAQKGFMKRFFEAAGNRSYAETMQDLISEQIAVVEQVLKAAPGASLIGGARIRLNKSEKDLIRAVVDEHLPPATDEQREKVAKLLQSNLHKKGLAESTTGIVVAGFGSDELFPTLSSFEMEGMLADRLKFYSTNFVDICRSGERARVLPFAQREMVERFLYGLDVGIERKITQFCKSAVPSISEEIIDSLEMSDDDRAALKAGAKEAEHRFIDGLAQESFAAIRQESRSEIEDMVEFMPKPEMAKMAEALVNLTSIKRRVSRGMETVGGPIDVALISKAEGFIWVKRKHYFPEELNHRFFERMRSSTGQTRRSHDEQDVQPGNAGPGGNGPAARPKRRGSRRGAA